MKYVNETNLITNPKNQLILYGYNYYFNLFSKLYFSNKLPNTIFKIEYAMKYISINRNNFFI